MTDTVYAATRSRIMSSVPQRDTQPELKVRSLLHRLGYRFRVAKRNLPGRPDIVLTRYRSVIFVHGCFWHQHAGCRRAAKPNSNAEYWLKKLNRNVQRDIQNARNLKQLGWRVLVIWECELRDLERVETRIHDFFQYRTSEAH